VRHGEDDRKIRDGRSMTNERSRRSRGIHLRTLKAYRIICNDGASGRWKKLSHCSIRGMPWI
jgi:hypothetical protein